MFDRFVDLSWRTFTYLDAPGLFLVHQRYTRVALGNQNSVYIGI